MRRVLTILSMALSSATCGGPPSDTSRESEIALEQLFRVGSDATPERAPFGSVVDIEIGDDGSVFILDALSRSVSVFDSVGRPLGSFGRRGQGPGELEEPVGLTWGPDGDLWVLDLGTGRFTVFDPGGELAATYRASGPAPWSPLVMRFSRRGVLSAVALDLPGGSLERPNAVLVDYSVGELAVEPVRQQALAFVRWPDIFDFRGDAVTLLMAVPFSPEPMFGIDPRGRLWYGDSALGRVGRWLAADSFDLTVGRDLPTIPVTAADVARVLEGDPDAAELEALGGPSVYSDFLARIPDHQPRLRGFFFDDGGSVWVMRTPADDDGMATVPTDVYDGTGELLGSVELAVAATPRPRVRGGRLAGIVRDELGVESVAVYRVRR